MFVDLWGRFCQGLWQNDGILQTLVVVYGAVAVVVINGISATWINGQTVRM